MNKAAQAETHEYLRVPCTGELTHQSGFSLHLHTGALKQGQSLVGSRDGGLVLFLLRPQEVSKELEE